MFIDHFCCVPQSCLFLSATSTHVPPCLSAASLFELDLVFDFHRASPTCARAPGLAVHEGPLSPSRELAENILSNPRAKCSQKCVQKKENPVNEWQKTHAAMILATFLDPFLVGFCRVHSLVGRICGRISGRVYGAYF